MCFLWYSKKFVDVLYDDETECLFLYIRAEIEVRQFDQILLLINSGLGFVLEFFCFFEGAGVFFGFGY